MIQYETTEGTISVTNEKSNGNLVVGGFYTPSHQVENNKDNDGVCIQDPLSIIELSFQRMDFKFLANTISLMELVTTVLENTGQIIKQEITHR